MSYQALYRKYRPKDFDGVLGQDEITQVLRNQIRTGTISHAYLFSGIRGTGKTSMAKILAKAVNCLDPRDGNPCNECEVCQGVNQENFIDVMEIDAASNNGVDNIRELREHSKYAPSKGKYKVYIIDEVQMLSTGAFNALLKTLEEPSRHVVFILATTEPQKIPVTILSRCQRFDFKRVNLKAMTGGLETILKDLGVTCDEEVLPLIAQKSEGAMRDALSLLEKVVGFQGGHLSLDTTLKTLGYVAHRDLMKIFKGIFKGEVAVSLTTLDDLIKEGITVSHLLEQMLQFARNLMMIKVFKGSSEIIELPFEQQREIHEAFESVDLMNYHHLINEIHEVMAGLKYAANPRINLELLIIAMSLIFKGQVTEMAGMVQEAPQARAAAPIPGEDKAPRPEASESKASPPEGEGTVQGHWERVLKRVSDDNKMLYAFLVEGKPGGIKEDEISIVFDAGYEFHFESLMAPENKARVEGVIAEVFGKPYRIKGSIQGQSPQKKDPSQEIQNFLGDEYKDIFDIE